ncbi:D-glycero-alpha-D-manno-heptose-1,7-bisphosphate 7-phosphatase [Paludisphaera soli]|uniref:D-glycero-alpha-D-manno-heptose-1,7-bisphosphate 7-phosphatase n=1 Tax=Paludisphaera soli TaxID=2712865 RepID=UPI0013EA13E6|nr:HAD family hydrolase [Paludisphaera soli]
MSVERPSRELRPAVFLDRDDTIIVDVPYLADPAEIRLLPGAAAAMGVLRRAGFVLVLATNQSAVGRGIITEARLGAIHDELERLLAEQGAALDAIRYSTHAPPRGDRLSVEDPDRKPAPGMLLGAAREMGLDLESSWMVGDKITDVLAGLNAGCRSILVGSNATLAELPTAADPGRVFAAADLAAAASLILLHREAPAAAAPSEVP